jgi:hypothetical protein
MLSNPMDLSTVAELIGRGEHPNLLRLQEQTYKVMKKDYERTNVGGEFPLARFSEHCYQMRLQDEVAIAEELFQQELLCMERHKLVVRRQAEAPDKTVKTTWRFRHDKIAEFFIVRTFLDHGQGNTQPERHIDDPRFRSVLLLLANVLPLDAAEALREVLIQYSADTQDHTVSDSFIQALRMRKAA